MAPPTSVQPGWLSPEPVSSGEAFKPVLRGGGRGKQSAGEDGLRCKREEPGSPLRTFEPSLLPGPGGAPGSRLCSPGPSGRQVLCSSHFPFLPGLRLV